MRVMIASVALGVALLGFSWAQHPASVTWSTGVSVAYAAPVAYATPAEFDDFAWDDPTIRS